MGSSSNSVTLDTISLAVPDYLPDIVLPERFLYHNGFSRRFGEIEQTTGIKIQLPKGHGLLGISRITIIPKLNTTELEFSSKILKQDAPKLISENTVEQALEGFTRTGLIRLDTKKVLDRAEICRIDVTRDIHTDHDIEHYIDTLSHISTVDPRYAINKKASSKTGLTWERYAKTPKAEGRFTLYGKEADMKKPENKLLREFFLPSYFNKVLRFENREKNHSKIRKLFSLEDGPPLLRNVLSSRVDPYIQIFDNVFPSSDLVTLTGSLSAYRRMKSTKGHRIFFLKMLLREHGSIERALSVHLKIFPKSSNPTRLRKELRDIENESKSGGQKNNESEVLTELRDKLSYSRDQ